MNVPFVAPAGMAIPEGTKAGDPAVQSSMAMPPVGAAVLRVTVPVIFVPPLTVVGFTDTVTTETVGDGVTVSTAVLLTLL